jgi:hypothetical protein
VGGGNSSMLKMAASTIRPKPIPEKIRTPSSDLSEGLVSERLASLVERDEIAGALAPLGMVSLKTSVGMARSSWLQWIASKFLPASFVADGIDGVQSGNELKQN